jgi:polyisoprenoid-binding protein YceI
MTHDLSAVAPGIYTIDPSESRIEFTTTHWFGLGKVQGSFAVTSGELIVADPIEESSVRAVASTASFSTNNARRDSQIRGKAFLDSERHPQLSFDSTSIVFEGDTATLYGTLTVKGNQEQITFAITDIEAHETSVTAVATAHVDRHEHGVSAMPGIAGRYLDITVRFIARLDR